MSEQQTDNPIRGAIAEAIRENDVILFMKGNPDAPACGFSARAVAALQATGSPFAAVDILPDPRIRQELSAISGWPTIPQLFVGGELLGGSDIIVEMYESGELGQALGVADEATPPAEPAVAAEPATRPGPRRSRSRTAWASRPALPARRALRPPRGRARPRATAPAGRGPRPRCARPGRPRAARAAAGCRARAGAAARARGTSRSSTAACPRGGRASSPAPAAPSSTGRPTTATPAGPPSW